MALSLRDQSERVRIEPVEHAQPNGRGFRAPGQEGWPSASGRPPALSLPPGQALAGCSHDMTPLSLRAAIRAV